jgi:acetyltransferase-like isoleucine patch superfamily enzyme
MIKKILQIIINITKPFVCRLAIAYDIKVEKRCWPTGKHLVIIEGDAKNTIPKSVVFNTRSGKIVVGRGTGFGEDVHILTGKHFNIAESEKTGMPLHHVPEVGRDVIIGKNCFIGSGAILIGPLNIGDFSVIGAGSVVTKDVPIRGFVAGVPAKLIKIL